MGCGVGATPYCKYMCASTCTKILFGVARHVIAHIRRVLDDCMGASSEPPPPPPRERTIYGRFRALPPKQRVLLGIFGMAFSGCGLMLSNGLEKRHMEKERAVR